MEFDWLQTASDFPMKYNFKPLRVKKLRQLLFKIKRRIQPNSQLK